MLRVEVDREPAALYRRVALTTIIPLDAPARSAAARAADGRELPVRIDATRLLVDAAATDGEVVVEWN